MFYGQTFFKPTRFQQEPVRFVRQSVLFLSVVIFLKFKSDRHSGGSEVTLITLQYLSPLRLNQIAFHGVGGNSHIFALFIALAKRCFNHLSEV